jgi:hypothetical protein
MQQTDSGTRQRTGILTLHYGFNEGAILQAYALSELLRFVFDGDIEIVDQRYPSKMAAYGDPHSNERTRALSGAIDGWLPLSAEHYRCSDSARLIHALGDHYDRLVFGSDVLWGLQYRGRFKRLFRKGIWPRQRNPFFPAYPNIYWPSATQQSSKVVFAASIGSFNWHEIPGRHARMMRAGLESCCAISVRDERTMDFVSRLSESLASRVCMLADPTFAQPFRALVRFQSKDETLKERLRKMGVDFSRPRCLVVARSGETSSRAVDYFSRRDWQTVGVTAQNDRCALQLHDRGFHPLEWARLFGWFDVCVTERMHGAIFSLLNNTPFVAIEMNKVGNEELTKTRSLLRRFNLEDILLEQEERDPATLQQTFERVIGAPWDWARINGQIEAESDRQIEFLQGS